MEHKFCQSCGMPLTTDNKGTNADGSRNEDYCIYCYKDGRFTQDFTMEQMIEHCAQFTDEINKESGQTLTQEQAKDMMRQFFPQLKRWKNRTAMFIAILTYKKPLEEVDRFLQAHRDYLAEHYAAGDFIASGPQTPRVGRLHHRSRSVQHQRNCRLPDCGVYSDNVCRIEPFRHTKISTILMVNKRAIIIWLAITILVMLALPFAVARLASECSGMALCMMLFLIVNPIYSAILGYRCGKDIKKMWNLPLVSAVAFLAGIWIFFDIHELWFVVYATVYLAIGWIAMAISKYLNRRVQ